jgi:hypothetical protein
MAIFTKIVQIVHCKIHSCIVLHDFDYIEQNGAEARSPKVRFSE